jgi:rare lipoprotein A (peptidoglycan hydrolase)
MTTPRRPWLMSRGRRTRPSSLPVRHIVYGSFSVLMLLITSIVLLVGSQIFGHITTSERGPPARLAAHLAARLPPSTKAPSHPSGTSVSTTVSPPPPASTPPTAPAVAAAAVAAPKPAAPAKAKAAILTTIASWYGQRPLACYDPGRRLALPDGIAMWAASRTLPCGTTIVVTGPAGTVDLLIEDHGPYLHPGRDLDLSPEAFRRVAGPLGQGLVRVTYTQAP